MSTKLDKQYLHIATTSFHYEGSTSGTGELIITDIKNQEDVFDAMADQISPAVLIEKTIQAVNLSAIAPAISKYKNESGSFGIGDIVLFTDAQGIKSVHEIDNIIDSFKGIFLLSNKMQVIHTDLELFEPNYQTDIIRGYKFKSEADFLRHVVKRMNNIDEHLNSSKSMKLLIAEAAFDLLTD